MSSEHSEQNEKLCRTTQEEPTPQIRKEVFPYISEIEIETSKNVNDVSIGPLRTEKATPQIQKEDFQCISEVQIETSKNVEDNSVRPLQPSDSYNGAVRDTYTWSQSINDIDVLVNLPVPSLKVKDIRVDIEAQKISVHVRTAAIKEGTRGQEACSKDGEEPEWTVLLEGELMFKTRKDESVWSLVPGYVSIYLEKASERWWDALITEEPKIDLSKMDCSRKLNEMDTEEQMKIEELMWNHQQKLMGKPTSDQLKMEAIMKEAWNAEGSPFQGTPYDPSIIKFN